MKPNIRRPVVTKGSLIVPVFVALTMLAFCIYGAPGVVEDLKSGQSYTLAAFWGDGTKVSEGVSPIAFWMNVGLNIAGLAVMSIGSIFLLCGVVIDHKRKKEAATKEEERPVK
jgi:hypothetical protein